MKVLCIWLQLLLSAVHVAVSIQFNYPSQREALQEPFGSPTSACFDKACEHIKDEVESLSRLKIVRTYVTETVKLLDSLMESMDEELVNLAVKIKETGAENCPDLPSPLDYIAQPMRKEKASALSAGIMEESMVSEYRSSQEEIGSNVGYEDDLTSGIEQSNSDSDERHGWSGSSHSSSSARSESNYKDDRYASSQDRNSWSGRGSSSGDSNSWSPGSSSWSQERENEINSGGASSGSLASGSQNSGSWNSQGSSRSESKGRWKGRQLSNANGQEQTNSGYSSSSWQPVQTTSGRDCRGVRDSPYYVPGIDNWCKDNCNRGYCPASHCFCQ